MEITDIHRTIVLNLYRRRCIGARHTHREQAVKGIKDGKKANKIFNELVRNGLINSHPTHYGEQVSLDPKRLKDIRDMIK